VNGYQFEVSRSRRASDSIRGGVRDVSSPSTPTMVCRRQWITVSSAQHQRNGHGPHQLRQSGPTRTWSAPGTELRNVAYITFDQNAPIARTGWTRMTFPKALTRTNRALVTIDADPPRARWSAPPARRPSAKFTVAWNQLRCRLRLGRLRHIRQTNGGPWTLWLNNAITNAALFWQQQRDVRVLQRGPRQHRPSAAHPHECPRRGHHAAQQSAGIAAGAELYHQREPVAGSHQYRHRPGCAGAEAVVQPRRIAGGSQHQS